MSVPVTMTRIVITRTVVAFILAFVAAFICGFIMDRFVGHPVDYAQRITYIAAFIGLFNAAGPGRTFATQLKESASWDSSFSSMDIRRVKLIIGILTMIVFMVLFYVLMPKVLGAKFSTEGYYGVPFIAWIAFTALVCLGYHYVRGDSPI